jgi:hypothetical protein
LVVLPAVGDSLKRLEYSVLVQYNYMYSCSPRVIKDKTIAAPKADINKRRLWKGNILFHMITPSSTALTSADSVAPIFELDIVVSFFIFFMYCIN